MVTLLRVLPVAVYFIIDYRHVCIVKLCQMLCYIVAT